MREKEGEIIKTNIVPERQQNITKNEYSQEDVDLLKEQYLDLIKTLKQRGEKVQR